MSRRASPALVGAFVIGAIVVAAAFVVLLAGGRLFSERHRFVIYFPESVHGLREGAAVKLKGVDVGSVRDFRFDLAHRKMIDGVLRVPVVIEIEDERVGGGIDLGDRETIDRLIAGGLRATLEFESYITGLRFVSLDIDPSLSVELVATGAEGEPDYPEIPATPSLFARAAGAVDKAVAILNEVDVQGLIDSVQALVDSLRELADSPELDRAIARMDEVAAGMAAAVKQLRRVLDAWGPDGRVGKELERTMSSMRVLFDPEGTFYLQLDSTLSEVQDAARSLRRLADQLTRDPGSILRGGRP